MSKELEYINNKIKDIEYRIAHPTEYNLTPTIKVKINDSACYQEELKILKSIKAKLERNEKNEQTIRI